MVRELTPQQQAEITYPDSDGQPMADNTQQFRWIVTIKENLERLFADDANVFVAGDLLWYPVEGDNRTRRAPDAMVVFGRPKGDRGSYKQWEENNIAPQVVFEILSPGNTLMEMSQKRDFYDRHGVEEYYIYDPDTVDFVGSLRRDNSLTTIAEIQGWVSPRLGIRFQLEAETLKIYTPSGEPFLSFLELDRRRQDAEARAILAQEERDRQRQRADAEQQRATQAQEERDIERQRAEAAEARLRDLEARLRDLGLNSEDD